MLEHLFPGLADNDELWFSVGDIHGWFFAENMLEDKECKINKKYLEKLLIYETVAIRSSVYFSRYVFVSILMIRD